MKVKFFRFFVCLVFALTYSAGVRSDTDSDAPTVESAVLYGKKVAPVCVVISSLNSQSSVLNWTFVLERRLEEGDWVEVVRVVAETDQVPALQDSGLAEFESEQIIRYRVTAIDSQDASSHLSNALGASLAADIDGNEKVNGKDVSAFNRQRFDMNIDSKINGRDVAAIASWMGTLQNADLPNEAPEPPTNNQIPVVDAGEDITLVDVDGIGFVSTMLSGSATDLDGEVVDVWWELDGEVVGQELVVDVYLPIGIHVLTLKAKDHCGLIGEDSVTVTVEGPPAAPENQAPIVDAGEDVTLFDFALAYATLSGSAIDLDGEVVDVWWEFNGQIAGYGLDLEFFLPQGSYTFTLKARDNEGLVSEDSVTITVLMP